MKIFLFCIIIIGLYACTGTKFSYATDDLVDNLGSLESIEIDSTYQLYLRRVIKEKDPLSGLYIPSNGPLVEGATIIELQYLFYSDKHKKVVVLNNIPDSRKKFYNSEDKLADLRSGAETVKVDIWYLRQFRFGRIVDNSTLAFSNINGGTTHYWNITREDNDSIIKLRSISLRDEFGTQERTIAGAFSLDMLFRRVSDFKLVFKYNANKSLSTSIVDETDLPKQTFYLSQKDGKKQVVFRFDTAIVKHFDNIVFFNDRVYAHW